MTLNRAIVLSFAGLMGCAPVNTADDSLRGVAATFDPAEAVDDIDDNLARLDALQVFEVGQLILDVPEEAFHCYGVCPEWEDEVAAAEKEAAVKLAALADLAEDAVEEAANAYVCQNLIEANLAALDGLEIVEVAGLMLAEPANNPSCYNLPCQEDIAAADAINNERAWKLHNIVGATTDL